MGQRIIEVKNLEKTFKLKVKEAGLKSSFESIIQPTYKTIQAVNCISFNVERGETLAFIGPNGAGKSTTIKMLSGILHPSSGEMEVLGFHPTKQRKDLSYRIGTVFGQKSQLWFHLPPLDSFKLLGYIYDIPKGQLEKRIKYLAEIFEIQDLMDIPVRKMSLGQRIRCEIVASILHEPEVIFLDEPTIGLDVVVKQKIRKLITKINQEENTTIFLTSHDAGDIEQLCERAIVINHGDIVFNDSVDNLKQNYLKNKMVQVKHDKPLGDLPKGLKLIKQEEYLTKFEVDTNVHPIDVTISTLLHSGSINDITIEDVPLEEIIVDIYQDKGGRSD